MVILREEDHGQTEKQAVEIVLELLIWLVVEVVGEAVAWILGPVWRGFVRTLNGPSVLLLWGAALAAMYAAWRMEPDASDWALWGRIALFILPPSFMMAATLAWRGRDLPQRLPRAQRPRRRNAY